MAWEWTKIPSSSFFFLWTTHTQTPNSCKILSLSQCCHRERRVKLDSIWFQSLSPLSSSSSIEFNSKLIYYSKRELLLCVVLLLLFWIGVQIHSLLLPCSYCSSNSIAIAVLFSSCCCVLKLRFHSIPIACNCWFRLSPNSLVPTFVIILVDGGLAVAVSGWFFRCIRRRRRSGFRLRFQSSL